MWQSWLSRGAGVTMTAISAANSHAVREPENPSNTHHSMAADLGTTATGANPNRKRRKAFRQAALEVDLSEWY